MVVPAYYSQEQHGIKNSGMVVGDSEIGTLTNILHA